MTNATHLFWDLSTKVLGKIWKTKTCESKKQKLLGVEIGRTLSFDGYIASLCRKTVNK